MEVENYLLSHNNLKIIQRKDMFIFSLDTVLLANFCTLNKDTNLIYDFGTNNAAIPLLLSTRTTAKMIGIEVQKEAVEIANKNIVMNNLLDQITIIHKDLKELENNIKANLIVCNPPFFKVDSRSNINETPFLQIARHEVSITLEEIIEKASKLLENKGRFAIVHRPDRLIDIINLMQKYSIEPKRLRMIYPKFNKDAHTVLVEGIFKGKPGLTIEPPLYAHNEDGSYSDEVKIMFGENKNV